jgi:hypothetical protein
MASKIKIIIVVSLVIAALVLAYIFLFKNNSDQGNLTSSFNVADLLPNSDSASSTPVDSNFLATLLNIRSIKLNDNIFIDPAFTNLRDSSIVLVQDGNEGRKNPFAPIGNDTGAAPLSPTLLQPN